MPDLPSVRESQHIAASDSPVGPVVRVCVFHSDVFVLFPYEPTRRGATTTKRDGRAKVNRRRENVCVRARRIFTFRL